MSIMDFVQPSDSDFMPESNLAISPHTFMKNYSMADTAYEHITTQMQEFQDELDTEHEVAVMLASFGQPVMLLVESIGYQNPNLLYFYGTLNGQTAQLIQHINQLNFVLVSVAKPPDRPARRIGFHVDEEPIGKDQQKN